MVASEANILSNFLLPPAPLHQILTQQEFIALFPRAHQSNPQVKTLYRDFQYQRAVGIDVVKKNIAAEANRGERQQRRIAQAWSKQDRPPMDDEAATDLAMETELFGDGTGNPTSPPHTIETIKPTIEEACKSIDVEIQILEVELEKKLSAIQIVVGELSDLRYGKFPRGSAKADDLGQQVLESLQSLETVCKDLDSPP